jgi:hypothetical protein
VHPVSTALFLLGYGLALPIGTKIGAVVASQNRLAIWGHHIGLLIAAAGWLMRGQVLVAAAHGLWLTGVSVWFEFIGSRRRASSGR